MDSIVAIISIALLAMITPGPNNFIVMHCAVKAGFRAAIPLILAVISGALCISTLVWMGIATLLEAVPWLQNMITIAGAGYLAFLGASLMLKKVTSSQSANQNLLPSTFKGVFVFQFFNPKSLVLISTLISELARVYSALTSMAILLILMLMIPLLCLTIWAGFGHLLSAYLCQASVANLFNKIMGGLLLVPALYVLWQSLAIYLT
jgi:threonine/homoserine/homoserine lactone efflux protein